MEITIKKIVPLLVMLAGVLGAVFTFLITLPTNDTVTAIAAIVATALGIIAATIRLLKQIDKDVATAVENYKNGIDNGVNN